MQPRIIDLDGGVLPQTEWRARHQPTIVSFADWGPRIRMACSFRRFARFEDELNVRWEDDGNPSLIFYGSGDFHHVSLALLRRLRTPFNLLVFDNHPDWMRGVPFLHCGTWLYHAALLPRLQNIYHVGGDTDFDNFYSGLAPWKMLRSGKITVFPAVREFQGGGWKKVPHRPVRVQPRTPARREQCADLIQPYREQLAGVPLYISLDKDVMVPGEAAVNWDSGHLTKAEIEDLLSCFIDAARGSLIGMDVLGEWSPVHINGLLRRLFHLTMHPTLNIDPAEANRINERTNLSLMACLGALAERGSLAS